ncbi:hypothetical protein R3Q06_16330 [Rhodococcus erythropolis]|uniref:hypothetical protein n=1 Tax=Rhodococcus erythropolis TaxID=1833 RepID=UPI00294A8642|nr:hypothetical protein [Rhodococcus erythropolis]MDV6275069.1 hypothetical protein [Rhodococcus erythropolis]
MDDKQRQAVSNVLAHAHIWRHACRELAYASGKSDDLLIAATDKELAKAAADLYRECINAEIINTDTAVRKLILEILGSIGTVRYFIGESLGNGGTMDDLEKGLIEKAENLAGTCENLHICARRAFGKETEDTPFPMGAGFNI